tara:strand:+ start:383 stop:604 length:222 start_codon:yes stop_codon:yes gene_type:complete
MQGDSGSITLTGNPKEIVDQITEKSEMAFRTREDLRRSYASMVSDWTGASMRFSSDEDLVDDLVYSGVLKEKK